MKIRFASGRPAAWRHRFVEIARQLDASAAAGATAAFGLRRRPGPAAAAKSRARACGTA